MATDRHYGVIPTATITDDGVTPDLVGQPKAKPLEAIGISGVRRNAGIIDEEFLPALRGRKAIKVFQEMSLNDPVVGSLLFTFEQLLKQTEWNVEPASQEEEDQEAADFLESCMDDMSKPWGDVIAEVVSMLTYGWCWSEVVYKKRIGPWEKDPKRRSRYDDGMIGWRKIEIRAQETMMRWIFDEDGSVAAMVQMAPPHYRSVVIPIERSLLFRFKQNKGSPEGISLLRTAYRPWFFKKRLEEFEAIGVERDLAGMPVARVPASMMNAPKDSKDYKTFQSFKQLVRGVRRDEHEGIVLPQQYDKETKQPLFDFELMSSGGARQMDTSSLIQRYEQRILMSVLADFILIGHEGQGSYAMHVDKTGIFRAALNAVARSIADTFNRHAVPKLFAMNGWRPKELPKITPSNVDSPNLTELAGFMSQMAGMGMEWFPDADIEKFLRNAAGLPDLADDKIELRRKMAEKMDMIGYAETQMEALGAKQKAEMSAQGVPPEQAEAMAQGQDPNAPVDPETGEPIDPETGEPMPPGGGMPPEAGGPMGGAEASPFDQEMGQAPVEEEPEVDPAEPIQEITDEADEAPALDELGEPVDEPTEPQRPVEEELEELGDQIGEQADEIPLDDDPAQALDSQEEDEDPYLVEGQDPEEEALQWAGQETDEDEADILDPAEEYDPEEPLPEDVGQEDVADEEDPDVDLAAEQLENPEDLIDPEPYEVEDDSVQDEGMEAEESVDDLDAPQPPQHEGIDTESEEDDYSGDDEDLARLLAEMRRAESNEEGQEQAEEDGQEDEGDEAALDETDLEEPVDDLQDEAEEGDEEGEALEEAEEDDEELTDGAEEGAASEEDLAEEEDLGDEEPEEDSEEDLADDDDLARLLAQMRAEERRENRRKQKGQDDG